LHSINKVPERTDELKGVVKEEYIIWIYPQKLLLWDWYLLFSS
jgi:hypothetical protein